MGLQLAGWVDFQTAQILLSSFHHGLEQGSPTPSPRPGAGPWPGLDRAKETDLPPTPHAHPQSPFAHTCEYARASAPHPIRECVRVSPSNPTLCACTRAPAQAHVSYFVHVHECGSVCPAFPNQSMDFKRLGTAGLEHRNDQLENSCVKSVST